MTTRRFWNSWLSTAAVLLLALAAPALAQMAPGATNITVYESPT